MQIPSVGLGGLLSSIDRDFIAKRFDVTLLIGYTSYTFDENLYIHINRDLADNVGRESDTS